MALIELSSQEQAEWKRVVNPVPFKQIGDLKKDCEANSPNKFPSLAQLLYAFLGGLLEIPGLNKQEILRRVNACQIVSCSDLTSINLVWRIFSSLSSCKYHWRKWWRAWNDWLSSWSLNVQCARPRMEHHPHDSSSFREPSFCSQIPIPHFQPSIFQTKGGNWETCLYLPPPSRLPQQSPRTPLLDYGLQIRTRHRNLQWRRRGTSMTYFSGHIPKNLTGHGGRPLLKLIQR